MSQVLRYLEGRDDIPEPTLSSLRALARVDAAASFDVGTLARGLHRDQTFDAECYASEFDAPDCPCRRNIERILVAAESVTESVTDAPDGSGQSGGK